MVKISSLKIRYIYMWKFQHYFSIDIYCRRSWRNHSLLQFLKGLVFVKTMGIPQGAYLVILDFNSTRYMITHQILTVAKFIFCISLNQLELSMDFKLLVSINDNYLNDFKKIQILQYQISCKYATLDMSLLSLVYCQTENS